MYIPLLVKLCYSESVYTAPRYSAMPKNKLLSVRIDPDLKKRARRVATGDGRSLSNWVTRLIEREVDKAQRKKDHES